MSGLEIVRDLSDYSPVSGTEDRGGHYESAMNDIIKRYSTWLRSENAAESTIKQRVRFARSCLAAWGTFEAVSVEQVRELIAAPDLAKWTRSTYYGHLRSLFRFLLEIGVATFDPTEIVSRPRPPKPTPRPLNSEELDRVLRSAKGVVREWVYLALYAGLRAHEIAKIAGEDVTEEAIFIEGKGGVRAFVPTHEKVWAIAQRRPRKGPWYPAYSIAGESIAASTVTSAITDLFSSLGIEGSTHRLRHNFGTGLVDAGVPITTVQSLMRHANLNTTSIYIKDDEEKRRAGIAALSFGSAPARPGSELATRRRDHHRRGRACRSRLEAGPAA